MSKSAAPPRHPGEILKADWLEPAGLSETALARALGIDPPRINELVRKRRGMTADTALRLARYFGGDPRAWLVMQMEFDLREAELKAGKLIEQQVTPRAVPNRKSSEKPGR